MKFIPHAGHNMSGNTGKVIFLNGASSSGKTTIARELQKEAPYLNLSVDAFLHQLPSSFLEDDTAFARALPRLLAGFNSSSAAVARAGNDIIVDTVLQEPSWLAPCVLAYEGLEVLFVGVRCAPAVLESREKSRGDRREGMARYQHDRVHSHGEYDIEVDTSAMPLSECVSRIVKYGQSGIRPSAFNKLQAMSRGCV
jgi:chloramphenicol 3-O phosphotransferase